LGRHQQSEHARSQLEAVPQDTLAAGGNVVTHIIHFSRQTNRAVYPMPPDVADYAHRGPDPYFAVARNMLDAGVPDGPAVFVDERGMACLTVRSLHSCARRYAAKMARLERLNGKVAA